MTRKTHTLTKYHIVQRDEWQIRNESNHSNGHVFFIVVIHFASRILHSPSKDYSNALTRWITLINPTFKHWPSIMSSIISMEIPSHRPVSWQSKKCQFDASSRRLAQKSLTIFNINAEFPAVSGNEATQFHSSEIHSRELFRTPKLWVVKAFLLTFLLLLLLFARPCVLISITCNYVHTPRKAPVRYVFRYTWYFSSHIARMRIYCNIEERKKTENNTIYFISFSLPLLLMIACSFSKSKCLHRNIIKN